MKNNELFQAFHVHQPHAFWVQHFYWYSILMFYSIKTGGQGEEEELFGQFGHCPNLHPPHQPNTWTALKLIDIVIVTFLLP